MIVLTAALILYALAIVGVLVWASVVALRFKGTLKAEPLPAHTPLISAIVPARNEARNIGRCASGLSQQDYPNLQLIFVDDESEDATPDILAGFARSDGRIRIVSTGGKPDGWNGKQWACHSGALQATGDWLCFMDADTYAEPQLISRTLAFAEAHHIDMLSIQPWYEMVGLWERIVLPAILAPLLFMYAPQRVNDPHDRLAIANGQFILIRRAAYDAVDGHAGVKDRMMDDFPLAENVKRAGYRLFMAEGMEVMRVRMYHNLREIWSGVLKASVDATGGWRMSLVALAANLMINVFPALLLLWGLFNRQTAVAGIMGAVVAFQVIYAAVSRMVAFRAPPWSAIAYMLGSLITSFIIIDGMLRVAIGRDIRWKNRPVMRAPAPSRERTRN